MRGYACAGLRVCVLSTAHWEDSLSRKPRRPMQSQTNQHLPILSQDARPSLLAGVGGRTHRGGNSAHGTQARALILGTQHEPYGTELSDQSAANCNKSRI